MMKLILLCGLAGIGGFIGVAGVSRVKHRLKTLRELKHDMETMENLIVRQSMTLREALCSTACASSLGRAYRMLAESIAENADSAEAAMDSSGIAEELRKTELMPREIAVLRGFFIRLTESISAEEVGLTTERYTAEIGRLAEEVAQSELARAKVMQKVWLLVGVGLVIILI